MRKSLSYILTFLMALCFAIGTITLFSVSTVKAESVFDNVDLSSFVMEKGASIRVSDDDNKGIRYQVNLDGTTYQTLEGMGASYGVIIVPADYVTTGYELTEANVFGSKYYFEGETVEENAKKIVKVESETLSDFNGDGVYDMWGSLVKVNEANFTREFIGLGFVKVGDNYKFAKFADGKQENNTRSIYYVAQIMQEKAVDDEEFLEIAELAKEVYIDEYADVAATNAGRYAYTVEHVYKDKAGEVVKTESEVLGGDLNGTAVATPKTDVKYVYNEGSSTISGTLYANGKTKLTIVYDDNTQTAQYTGGYEMISSGAVTLDVSKLSKEIAKAVDGTNVILTGVSAGENIVQLYTDVAVYEFKCAFAEKVLSTPQDVSTYFGSKAGHDGIYAVLSNDIDMSGATIADIDSWGIPKLDGLGHTLANFSTPNGLFGATNPGSIIRNIQFVNIIKTGSGSYDRGFFGQYYAGLVENILLVGKWGTEVKTNQSILYGVDCGGATFRNVVINVEMPSDFYFAITNGCDWTPLNNFKLENVYFIGSRIGTELIEDDGGHFALPTQFTSTSEITTSNVTLSDAWTVENGKLPYMSKYVQYLDTVKLTYNGGYEVISEGAVTLDLTKLNKTVSNIEKITLDSVDVTSSLNGNTIVLSGATAGEKAVKIFTDVATYDFKVSFAEKVLSTKQDVIDYFANYNYQYTVLANDVNVEGASLSTPDWSVPKLDGLGHSIVNATTVRGIIPNVDTSTGTAILRNIQFINLNKTGGDMYTGFIGREYAGLVENVLITGKFSNGVDGQALTTGLSQTSITIKNLIIQVEMVDFSNSALLYLYGGSATGWGGSYDSHNVENSYVISSNAISQVGSYAKPGYFTSASEITASNVKLSDVWTVENGKLPYMSDYSQYVTAGN